MSKKSMLLLIIILLFATYVPVFAEPFYIRPGIKVDSGLILKDLVFQDDRLDIVTDIALVKSCKGRLIVYI